MGRESSESRSERRSKGGGIFLTPQYVQLSQLVKAPTYKAYFFDFWNTLDFLSLFTILFAYILEVRPVQYVCCAGRDFSSLSESNTHTQIVCRF